MKLSVVISTFNRAEQFSATLEHFRGLRAEGLSWELIIIDNASSDATPRVIEQFSKSLPIKTQFESVPGKNRALNRAMTMVSGELIVFTDDDILPNRDWLLELNEGAIRWPNDSIFSGEIRPKFPLSAPDWMTSPSFEFGSVAFGRYLPQVVEGPTSLRPFGGNFMIRNRLQEFVRYREDVGPMGNVYGMASESTLLQELQNRGERFIYLPQAWVEHVIREDQISFQWLCSRAYSYGQSLAIMEGAEEVAHLFGVPRYKLRQLVELWCYRRLRHFSDAAGRFEAARREYEMRGFLSEYRKRCAVEVAKKIRPQ